MSDDGDEVLIFEKAPDESESSAFARQLIRPSLNAGASIKTIGRINAKSNANVNCLVDELRTQIKAVNEGDMSRPEALLVAQAHTLDALFGRLLDSAVSNMGEYLGAVESYMRLALKAQAQTAQTIRVLNELKNPKNVAFIQQANLASGYQQINNAPARENEKQQNELLEAKDGERMDFGTQTATSRVNTQLETVGPVDGAEE